MNSLRTRARFLAAAMLALALVLALSMGSALHAENVSLDNGNGTIDLPPFDVTLDPIPYVARPGDKIILSAGIPGGTIEMVPTLTDYFNVTENPGGNLGGDRQTYQAAMVLDVDGTGSLAGFQRMLFVPMNVTSDSAPRVGGDAVQDFARDMFRFEGNLVGDPDFTMLDFSSGTDLGLPGPGNTTLTRLGPAGSDFRIESFFDIEYQILWEGAPGSILEGLGTSAPETGSFRIQIIPEPSTGLLLAVVMTGATVTRRRRFTI